MQGDWEACTQEAMGIQLPADFPYSVLSAQQLYIEALWLPWPLMCNFAHMGMHWRLSVVQITSKALLGHTAEVG